jgi:cysteinyl-tRNA synthetase
MDLTLYDTLTREKRPFRPLDPANVRMYVCGPTVYDFAHIGNARPVIVFDVLFRLLRHLAQQGLWHGGRGETKVTYARNITDVDDKINARAAEEYPELPLNEAIRKVTEKTDKQFHADVAALGCLAPTVEPRATETVAEMRTLIEQLVKSGNAYVAEDNVLFSVASMPDYGKLSKRPLDEMIAGARVEVAPYKRAPMDFVLWKPSKPGEPSWPSPCGIAAPGRPGWHIECSAMSWKFLGEIFDIHGGGIDLVFPHHENEIAQSRSAFHTPLMANFWMHNGFLQVEGEKMSKSLGNFFTIQDLRRTKKFGGRRWNGSALRFAMLQTHYRQPIDWTVNLLEQSESRLERWKSFASGRTGRRSNPALFDEFLGHLADDLNTPAAFSVVDKAINEELGIDEDRYTIYKILKLLGIKAGKSRVAVTADQFQQLIKSIGTLSRNDWDNLLLTWQHRPMFKSGRLKPEAKLVGSLDALSELSRELIVGSPNSEALNQFTRDLVRQGTPAETEFEARVRRLVADRDAARKAKDFATSDRIREDLAKMGIEIKETPEGTKWTYTLRADAGKYELTGRGAKMKMANSTEAIDSPASKNNGDVQ